MKKLIKTIGVNEKIYNRLDEGEKSLIKILALTIPISAIVTGLVFFYAIDLLLNSTFIAAIGGLLIGLLTYLHDSTMLAGKGNGRACFRLLLSLLFAIVLSVPVKVKLMGDTIHKVYEEKIEAYNLQIDAELLKAKEIIFREEQAIDSELAEAGKRYDQNNKNTQHLVELRRKKKNFLAQKEAKLQGLEKLYEAKKKPIEVSKVQLCAFFYKNYFSGNSSPEESLYNAMILLILLMFEALPAIIRLKLEDSKYLAKIEHRNLMIRKAEDEREAVEVKILRGNMTPEELLLALDQAEYLEELETASRHGLSKNREALIGKVRHVEAHNASIELPASTVPPTTVSPSVNNLKADPCLPNKDNNNFPKFDYSKD